jgi:hypothetical protein
MRRLRVETIFGKFELGCDAPGNGTFPLPGLQNRSSLIGRRSWRMKDIEFIKDLKNLLTGWGMPEDQAKSVALDLVFGQAMRIFYFSESPHTPQAVQAESPCTDR